MTASKKKIVLFRFFAALIPLLMFALIELALNIIDVLPERDLFVPVSIYADQDASHLVLNRKVGERYFSRGGMVPTPWQEDLFLKKKTDKHFRVFVMGASIITGWPYPPHVGFSRILEQRLQDALPGKEVEVINLGVFAFSSYSLLDMMDEVLEQEPDVILMYTGHNEFYGGLGAASTATLGKTRWVVRLNLWLQEFKTVQAAKESIFSIRQGFANKSKGDEPPKTLMGKMVGNREILLGDEVYERGQRQFEANLVDIFRKAGKAGVPIVIGDLVSNLRDTKPFVSVDVEGGESADQAFEEAKILEAQGKFGKARKAYARSKDLDALRFRAPEAFDNIIRDTARAHGGHLVSLQKYFDAASPYSIPGNNLFLEHLHPTAEGQFLMAEAYFNGILELDIVDQAWLAESLPPISYYRENWPITELDLALTDIRVLGLKDHWPFVPERTAQNSTATFKPQNRSGELAKEIFFNRTTYKQAQNELAQTFLKEGEYALAARAYRALMEAQPFDITNSNNAATSLINAGQFQAAIPFLEQSLKIEDSFFANKWLGQTLVSTNRVDEGISYMEKAKQIDATDMQLLSNLAKVYLSRGQNELAKVNLDALAALKGGHQN